MKSIQYVINNAKELQELITDLEQNSQRMEADIKESLSQLREQVKPANILKRAAHSMVQYFRDRHVPSLSGLENKSPIKKLLLKTPSVQSIELRSSANAEPVIGRQN